MKLTALIYRETKGCKQYSFDSIDELKTFTDRKPYCNEVLGVIAFHNRREVGRTKLPAAEVVDFVTRAIDEVRKVEETACSLATTVLRQAEQRDSECAFWFVSALSKLHGVRPSMNIGETLEFVMEAMPMAASGWKSYVAKTQGVPS